MNCYFDWEDSESARVVEFVCDCGYIKKEHEWMVFAGDTFQCPECGKKYGFSWGGMTAYEVKE